MAVRTNTCTAGKIHHHTGLAVSVSQSQGEARRTEKEIEYYIDGEEPDRETIWVKGEKKERRKKTEKCYVDTLLPPLPPLPPPKTTTVEKQTKKSKLPPPVVVKSLEIISTIK